MEAQEHGQSPQLRSMALQRTPTSWPIGGSKPLKDYLAGCKLSVIW
jgi:hypothetical protein